MTTAEAIALIVAAIALITLIRGRRADLRLALYNAQIEAAQELLRTLYHARHTTYAGPERPSAEHVAALYAAGAAQAATSALLSGEVIRAAAAYVDVAFGAMRDGIGPASDAEGAAHSALLAAVRNMLGTDPLSADTAALLPRSLPEGWRPKG